MCGITGIINSVDLVDKKTMHKFNQSLRHRGPDSQNVVFLDGGRIALCASDDCSPPNRFQLSHEKLSDGYNWFDLKKTLFLNLMDFTTATYINQTDKNTVVTMSTKTSVVKNLKGPLWPSSGIDGWMRTNGKTEPFFQYQENLLGLETDGANKINFDRRNHYPDKKVRRRYVCPYFPPEQKIEEILPEEIIIRLKNLGIEERTNSH